MELEKGKIVITKGKMYVGRMNNCVGMYHIFLSDEGCARRPSIESGGLSVENVSSVSGNDVTSGMITCVNEMSFSCYLVCSFFMA